MASPSAFERRQGIQGPTGPTGPAGPSGPSGPTGAPSPAITLSGNTTGTLTLVSTGTVTLAGGNNITLSQSGNHITISGANVGGAQTGISGIVGSNASFTSGTVTITGVGGGITVSSNTGQRIDLSVAAPVAQTNQSGNVYASSNTFGTSSGTYDARSLSIAGRGAVSVAASNSGWIVSAPAQTVQTQNVHNVTLSGNSTSAGAGYIEISSGTMTLAGGANITLSQNGNAVTVSGAAGGAFSAGMSTEGNTAGNTGVTGSRVVLVGSGPISLSQTTGAAGGTVSILGPATSSLSATGAVSISVDGSTVSIGAPTQTNQAGSVYASSNTFGTSSGTYDARSLSIAGRGDISVAASNSGWIISGPAQTNQAGSVYASSNTFGTSSGTYDARSLSIAGSGGVSVAASNSGWVISAAAPVAQTNQAGSVYASSNTFGTSSGTYDARSLSIAGSGGVSVAASNSGWVISAAAPVAQTNQAGSVYAASNTSGTSSGTYDARTLSIKGAGLVTVAASNSGWIIDATSAAQTNQAGSVYAISNTSGTSSGTFDARTLSIAGMGMITVAASNSGWRINATQSVQTENIMRVTLSGNSTSAGGGYVLISTGTMVLAGGANITLSQNANSVSILGGAGVGGGVAIAGSDTTYTSGTATITGVGGGVTVSSNTGQRIDISVAAPVAQTNQAGSLYAISNTSGTSSGTYDARTLSIAGNGPITVAASNSGFRIDAPATSSLSATGQVSISTNVSTISIGVPNPILSYRWIEGPLQMGATQGIGASNANGTQTTVTAWVQPVSVPSDLAFNNLNLAVHNSFSSATTSISSVRYSYSAGASVGFYTLNANTLSLVTSFSNTMGYTNQTAAAVGNMSFTGAMAYGGSTTSKTTQAGANVSAIMASLNSVRQLPLVWSTAGHTLTRGQYWAVVCFSQLTGSVANASLSQVGFVSNYSAIGSALSPPRMWGDTLSVTSPMPFMGLATLINASNELMPAAFSTSKITTATAIANSTNYQSIWMNIYSSHGT